MFLGGPHEDRLWKREVDFTEPIRDLGWSTRHLRKGQLVWYKADGEADFRLAQCVSDASDSNMIVLLTRNTRNQLETREVRVRHDNCRVTDITEETPMLLSYPAPGHYEDFFPPRRAGLVPFVDEYKRVLVNRATLTSIKFFSSYLQQDRVRWNVFRRRGTMDDIVELDYDWDEDSVGTGRSEISGSSAASGSSETASSNATVGEVEQEPVMGQMYERVTLHDSQLLVNIYLILNHWAKFNYQYDRTGRTVCLMYHEGGPRLLVEGQSKLSPELFTIERVLLDWLEGCDPQVLHEKTRRYVVKLQKMAALFDLSHPKSRECRNPISHGCEDWSKVKALTEKAHDLFAKAVRSAFRINFTGFDKENMGSLENWLRQYAAGRLGPRAAPSPSLQAVCLKDMCGMYIAGDDLLDFIRDRFARRFVHIRDVPPGSPLLVGRFIATLVRVVKEDLNIEELQLFKRRNPRLGIPVDHDLFNLRNYVLHYKLESVIDYSTTDWKSVVWLDV